MEKIRAKLKQAMKEQGISGNELAKRTGESQTKVNNLLQGKTKSPAIDFVDKLLAEVGIYRIEGTLDYIEDHPIVRAAKRINGWYDLSPEEQAAAIRTSIEAKIKIS